MTEVRVVKKRKDFIKVAKQGEKVVQPTLILQAAFNLSVAEDTCQIGYTVTKKSAKPMSATGPNGVCALLPATFSPPKRLPEFSTSSSAVTTPPPAPSIN